MYKPSDRKNYLISGVFIFVLLLIVSVTIFMLNKENPLFSRKINLRAEVKNAQSLKIGAAIQFKGIKIGSVNNIDVKDLDTLTINIGVEKDYAKWIKSDSYLAFKTQGVLGDKFLEILGGTETSPNAKEGDLIKVEENSQFEHIINKSEDLVVVASSILTKFDKILTNVQPDRLERIMKNLEDVTGNTNKLMSTINDKNISVAMSNLKQSTESMSKITRQIETGPGTLHALIYDQGLHEDLRSLVGGANRNKVLKYFIRQTIKKSDQ